MSMWRPFIPTFLLSVLLISSRVLAGEPSVGDLIKLAPVIQSSDDKYRSIELGGYCQDDDGNIVFRFRSLYRAPDRYTLLITDRDDTPISFASDGKLMVYDPLKGCVFYSPTASVGTSIRVEDGRFRYDLHQPVGSDDPSYIKLDVKSMLNGPSRGDEVVKTGGGKYRLKRTSNFWNNFYLFDIDTSSENPFQRIELINGPTNKVRFCVEKIMIDGPLGDELFAFPSKERLAEMITVREWTAERPLEAVVNLGLVTRIYYARAAVNYPELRDSPNLVNLYGSSKIDWEAIPKNDEKFSRAIKDLVLPRPKNLDRLQGSAPSAENAKDGQNASSK